MAGNIIGAHKRVAKHLGITLDEYLAKLADGLKWCTHCKTWKPRLRFDIDRSRGDGLTVQCHECRMLRDKRQLKDGKVPHELQRAASDALHYEIKKGRIPPVTTLPCADCGKPAVHYHHHLGYARPHWLDVIPLCRSCHRKRHYTEHPEAW